MRADLVALGVRLGWVGEEDKEEPAVAVAMERLRQEGEGVLLIFDNAMDADAIKPYLPRGGRSQILVTSNARAWRGVYGSDRNRDVWPNRSAPTIWSPGQAARRAHRRRGPVGSARRACRSPIEQAAAHCERLDISLADYRKRFEAAPTRLLDRPADAPAEYHDRAGRWRKLRARDRGSRQAASCRRPLIVHAALLAPEPIPLSSSLKRGKSSASRSPRHWLGMVSTRSWRHCAFRLVDRERIVDERDPAIPTDAIRPPSPACARSLRVVGGRGTEAARRALVEALAAVYPRVLTDDADDVAIGADGSMRHALAFGRRRSPRFPVAEASTGRSAERPGTIDTVLGAYAQAAIAPQRALAIREKDARPRAPRYGDDPQLSRRSASGPGRRCGARPAVRARAGNSREDATAPAPSTAWSLGGLPLCCMDQATSRARPLSSARWRSCEKALGPSIQIRHGASTVSPSCCMIKATSRGAAALRARAGDREKALGPEHPETSTSLNNLADLASDQGDLAGRAAALRARAQRSARRRRPRASRYGDEPQQPRQSASRPGRPCGARPLYERALAIREKALGPEHPHTAMSLNNLAGPASGQGDLAGARPLSSAHWRS